MDTPFWKIYSGLPRDLQSSIAYETNLYMTSRLYYDMSWLRRREDHLYDPIATREIIASLEAGDEIPLIVEYQGLYFISGGRSLSVEQIPHVGYRISSEHICSRAKPHTTLVTACVRGVTIGFIPNGRVLATGIPRILERRGWNYTGDELASYLDRIRKQLDLNKQDDVFWLLASHHQLDGTIGEKVYSYREYAELVENISSI